jgi:SOCE-associated regulatory factor of calcium homoeostasis/Tetratricopeptide repeat
MKKILLSIALAIASVAAVAEPSFDQMQELIAQKQYAAAESGLEVIIQNHPASAKAFYSMAQAQAGLGHLDKAQFALNKARGLDPTLKFASTANVEALQAAITPQAAKIQKVETGTNWLVVLLTVIACAIIGWIAYLFYKKDKPAEADASPKVSDPIPTPPAPEAVTPRTVTPAPARIGTADVDNEPYVAPRRSEYSSRYASGYNPTPAPVYVAPQPQTVVVNNSNDGFVTGMLVGEMMSSHHDHTRVVEREVIREVPVRETYSPPSRSSSWDDDSSSKSSYSSSSSWDDDRSSSSSSGWSSSSDSSSSSSWDSGSSSSSSSDW